MDPRRDIDASGNRVVNVANPSLGHHAATKTYVDTTTLLVHYRDPVSYTHLTLPTKA